MARFQAEIDFACFYSMSHPALARECVKAALECAIALGRPDLIYRANDLLGKL